MITFPVYVARAFTTDRAVIRTAIALLAVAAAFQLFDGIQTVATGALRGTGDTRTPMICHLVGYWLIGLPLGYALCFVVGWGAVGLWTGLCIALILIGLVLLLAWTRKVHALSASHAIVGQELKPASDFLS
jgi:MATE family multidrug resistance protein